MNTRFRKIWSIMPLALLIELSLTCGAPRAIAQDWLRLSGFRPKDSVIVRGQEPNANEMSEAERSEEEHDEHIETDRDSFTPATTITGRGRWIAEAAYSFIDNRDTFETHSFPEFLLRYGVNERFELRLGWNYEVGGGADAVSSSSLGELDEGPTLERESEISYGLKMAITEQAEWLPRSAFIVQGFTPTSGPDSSTDLVATYVFGWELPNHWELDAALRYGLTTAEGDRFNQWAPSVVWKVPVAERWNAHVEYFSIHTDGRANERSAHYVSPGVHYLVTPDLEVGFRFGWGLSDESSKFFNNVGLGWRF